MNLYVDNMVTKVLSKIMNDIRYKHKIEHIETLDSHKAVYKKVEDLPENIINYLKKNNIRLYEHQVETYEQIRLNKNVLLTTPTASGKTLSFNLPIMEKLTQDIRATALYIYPAKALTNDQLEILKKIETELKIEINPQIYDGDTPRNLRPNIRKKSRIVLSNPYELHLILSWHHQWERFYKNLKFIVIDEAHQYRGVFGSNVALLLRRLRRICNYYGSDPIFILSSATLANPLEFSEKLTGKKFHLVSKDASPSGKKYFILYNPFKIKNKLSLHQETTNLFLFFIIHNMQTLCFTVSRKMAEIITKWSKEQINSSKPELVNKIAAYRAGYLAEERRTIETSLKNKKLVGVTTTNALEVGINIGSLDSVIISGFPGTMISVWQQAGRSGRKYNDSIVVLLAFENPLDQYFMKNPKFIFDKVHENAIIDLENLYILKGHLLCAAYELPLTKNDLKKYFSNNLTIIEEFVKKGLLIQTTHNWTYNLDDTPSFKHSLDQISSDTFKVIHKGQILEVMTRSHAYREAHEGAVLINKGETYTVESFDNMNKIINVIKRNVDYHTQALKDVNVKITKKVERRRIGDLIINYGEVEVSENFYKYKILNFDKVLGTYPLDLPPLKFKTKSIWFTLPFSIKTEIETKYDNEEAFHGGLHGTEHVLIALFPLHVMCDRFDIGGLSTPYHNDTQEATIFIYDAYEGGIGLTEKALEVFDELVNSTKLLIENCQCKDGCPSCIYSPKCGNENKPLNKQSTIYILNKMIEIMSSEKVGDLIEKESEKLNDIQITDEIDDVKLLLELGYNDLKENNINSAINSFDNALTIDPSNVDVLFAKAKALDLEKNYDESLKYYKKINEYDSEKINIQFHLAKSLYHNKYYAEAKEILINMLTSNPLNDKVLCLIGIILEAQNDINGAKYFYKKAIKCNPRNKTANTKLKHIN